MHRLRFAPSPTGRLHVGSARTALLNWLFVKHYGGQFLLRIEDTDRARSTDESTRGIFEAMEWLGLTWDEEVTHQGANLARHRVDAKRLLDAGRAYRCFCTVVELDALRKAAEERKETFRYDGRCDRLPADEVDRRVAAGIPFSLRFRMPPGETGWDDLVYGQITFPNKDIGEGDFIVLRSDGTPVYNLAVVSDDIDSRITLVMRGDDHISNTPKQLLLYQALGDPIPRFGHLPNVNGPDGKKLSKRHGADSVGDYRRMGILPEALVNFLALIGWNPGDDVEVMPRPVLIERFSVEGLQKKSGVFDQKKLEWMNGQYLAHMPNDELAPLVARELTAAGLTTDAALETRRDWFHGLITLLKVRGRTIVDIAQQATPYFKEEIDYDADAIAKQWKDPGTAELLGATRDTLASLDGWDPGAMETALRALAESRGTTAGKLFQPLRVALTGQSASPGIFDVLMALGEERSLRRIDAAIARLKTSQLRGA